VATMSVARPGPRHKSETPRCKPRQANCREHRTHRQIFPVRNEMSLVVAADQLAARGKGEDAVGSALDVYNVPRRDGDTAGQETVVRAEERGSARTFELGEGLV